MYEKLSIQITNHLIKYNFVKKSESEIYIYSFQIILSSLVSTAFILILSILYKQVLNTMFFFVGFFMCRKLSGGYHANSQLTCFLLTQLIFISFLSLISFSNILENKYILFIIPLLSNIVVCLFAPVDNINNPFSDSEKRKFRKRSIIFALINIFLFLLTNFFPIYNVKYLCYSLGVFSISIMLALGKIKNIASLH